MKAWRAIVPVEDLIDSDEPVAVLARKAAARIREQDWFPHWRKMAPSIDLEATLDELETSQDVAFLQEAWDELYDWADAARVFLDPWKSPEVAA